MKSKVVSRPANVEVLESQSGADTMPMRHNRQHGRCSIDLLERVLTILNEDGEAVLHQKRGVEDDQAKAQGQHVVTGADFEEVSYAFLPCVRKSLPWCHWPARGDCEAGHDRRQAPEREGDATSHDADELR